MPLVTLCGLPAAGKTTFAEGLVAFLRKELPGQQGRAREEGEKGGGGVVVVLVNEEALHIQKTEGYQGERRRNCEDERESPAYHSWGEETQAK
eukprot:evm.model.NODE_12752_length_6997_cov_26.903816.1